MTARGLGGAAGGAGEDPPSPSPLPRAAAPPPPPGIHDDDRFMALALAEAHAAAAKGEVPVGAVVVRGGEVLARAHNLRETSDDPTAHAEVLAVREAAARLGSWRLDGCTLYVTLEPCFMCAGALVNARLPRLVFGAPDPKAGAVGSLADVVRDARLNHRIEVRSGVLGVPCGAVLKAFFAERRGRPSGGAGAGGEPLS